MSDESVSRLSDHIDKKDGATVGWRDRARLGMSQVTDRTRGLRHEAISDAGKVTYRMRRQLYPWYAAGAVGAIGYVATGLPDDTPAALLASSAGTGAFTLGVGAAAVYYWRNSIGVTMRRRVHQGAAWGCLWCTAMPAMSDHEQAMYGMTFALIAGTVKLASGWWQKIRPPYPTRPPQQAIESGPNSPTKLPEEVTAQATKTHELSEEALAAISTTIETFRSNVSAADGVLPAATISFSRLEKNFAAYRVQLRAGKKTVQSVRGSIDLIAHGIHTQPANVVIEPADEKDPNILELRVMTDSPVAQGVDYEGPVIEVDEIGTHIRLGPYTDGEGNARLTVLSEDSLNGGFVLGGTGSGKSRLLELIAIGLRKLGVQIWYLDPQYGQSSPALKNQADWALSGLEDEFGDPVGNVKKLLAALDGVSNYRSARLSADDKPGFDHAPAMPGVMAIIDECHEVMGKKLKEGAPQTYGTVFGDLARKFRKTGQGLLLASQEFTLPTFGNSQALRSATAGRNMIALRVSDSSYTGTLPDGMPNPATLPEMPGYGYLSGLGSERVAPFRGENIRAASPAEWLQSMEPWPLDAGSHNSAGYAFTHRHEIEQSAKEENERKLREIESGAATGKSNILEEIDAGWAQRYGTISSASTRTERTGTATALAFTDLPEIAVDHDTAVPARELTPRQQKLVDLLAHSGEMHTTDMAQELEVSEVTIRSIIRELGETRLTKVRPGVFRAKELTNAS